MIDFLYTIKNNVITYLKKTLGTHTRNKTIFFHKNKFLSITLFACQILLLVPSLSATIDLSYYAGSYHYCPKEKKVLSPLNGVIYYHRLIRGLYPEKNALAKFCQKLFYCVHGNGQQLYPTKDRNKTVTHLSPEVIAQLITTMEHFRITKEQEPEKIKTQLFLLINNNQAYQDSLIQTVDLYKKDREDALIKNFEENNNKELSSFVTSFINACFATGLLQENVSIKKSNKKRTVIALPYTPYYLLQAFVYRKYTTKDELLNFCNGLGINIPEKISKPQGEDEIRFYSILSHNDLPVIDDSLEVNFLLGKDEIRFADCMEHVLRHLIQFLVYDTEQQRFDSSRLLSTAADGKIDPDLALFFKKFPTPHQANTQEGHNEWSRLLTNRLGFSYTEFRDPLTKDKICGAFYHQSLLSSSRIINNHLYEPSPQEALLYELEVSMHNFIVILNDLLHLALFDIHNEQFIKASFFSEDFVDRYFLRLNKLLGHIVDQEQLFEDYNLYGREINLVAPQFIVSLYPQTHIKIRAREKNSNSCEELCADDTMLYKLLYLGINKKSLWEKLIKIDTEEATSTLIATEISRAYYHSSIDQGLTDDEVKELLGKKYLDYQKNNHSSLFSTLYKKIAIGSEEKFFRELCQNSHADFFSSLYSKEKIINLIQKPLNENLDTGLMITAVSGNKEIAQKILETINKHDVLKKVLTQHNRECSSVLLTAVKFNNSFLVEKIFELIKNDPDLLKTILTQQTRNGLTVLMLAARLGHLKILLTILHTLKEQPTLFLLEEVVTQQEQQGAHALIEATRSDSPRIVQALLESIKDYPALLKKVMILQDKELNNAFIGSSPEIMKIAIDATHAHPEILKNILTQQNNDGDTVLIKAARLGHTAVVEQLLNCVKQYPDILNYLLIQKEKYGRTALDEAISWQRKAVIELLSKNYSNGQKDEEPSITEQLVRLSVNNS